MSLSAEQKQAVASWIAAGESLSNVQKKLREQFQVSLTYMEVRFLVDDLDLTVKDPAPKPSADLAAKASAKAPTPSAEEGAPEAALPPEEEFADEALPPEDAAELEPEPDAGGASSVSVSVDKVNLIPGAVASGSVTFSDGVTGKWIVDHYGRPGFTEVSQPGYRPTPADGQAFMQKLSQALSRQGY